MLKPIGAMVILYLAVGVAAAAMGHTQLGRMVAAGTVSAGALALALYAGVRVLGGVWAILLRLWPFTLLQMVQRHRELFERRAYRLLLGLAVVGWGIRFLDHLGLLNPMVSFGRAILATKLERGSVSLSIGDLLAFALAIGASYLLSRLVRFSLGEEVYPRAHVPSGTAYAASRLVHYAILTLGLVLALGLLGVDLTKVTVLAGALGLGIGFGLQNVVNNMVCGLILLFERPIHVGDTIEVGGLFGEVRRIGFRASTVRTRRGADIIIPNAEFITANVTNWTLSDRLRRIDVPVGVNYASQPQRVIALLEEAARDRPMVLSHPAPQCFFTGYGDSAITFEIRVWTDRPADHIQIRSDLNAAVYDAVTAAGMSFPFPQREVRLLRAAEAEGPDGSPVDADPDRTEKGGTR